MSGVSVEMHNVYRKRNYIKGRKFQIKETKWLDYETSYLEARSDLTDILIAAVLGRSVQAVQMKRWRLERAKRGIFANS
jgi:hypothetical protein